MPEGQLQGDSLEKTPVQNPLLHGMTCTVLSPPVLSAKPLL